MPALQPDPLVELAAILLPIGLPATMSDRNTSRTMQTRLFSRVLLSISGGSYSGSSIARGMFLLTLAAALSFLLPAFLSSAFLPSAFAQTPVSSAVNEGILRDWQTRDDLDENAQRQLPSACCGLFVEPPRSGEFSARPKVANPLSAVHGRPGVVPRNLGVSS